MRDEEIINEIRLTGVGELSALIDKLTVLEETRVDVVAPTTTMRATIMPAIDNGKLQFESEEDGARALQRIELQFDEKKEHEKITHAMPLTNWGHRQLAEKCGIPIKYYEKLRDNGMLQLAADNVNGWIDQRARRFIRTQNGQVRAILSDKYKVMDHMQVIKAAGEKATEFGAKVAKCELTDTRLYMKLVVPHIIEEIRAGDKLIQGIVFSNSEVGAGSFRAEPFAMRLICKNGMIGMDKVARIHLGSKMEEGLWKSQETEDLEVHTIYSQVKDLVEATFNPDKFRVWMEALRQTTEVKLDSPSDAVKNVVKEYKIPEHQTQNILDALVSEGDPTQYGLVNAVTNVARQTDSIDGRIELERIGGELSVMEQPRFEKMIEVVA
jgi:hypothetical protein